MMTVDDAMEFARVLVTTADRNADDEWAALTALAAEVLSLRHTLEHWHQRATEEAFGRADAERLAAAAREEADDLRRQMADAVEEATASWREKAEQAEGAEIRLRQERDALKAEVEGLTAERDHYRTALAAQQAILARLREALAEMRHGCAAACRVIDRHDLTAAFAAEAHAAGVKDGFGARAAAALKEQP